MGSLTQVRGEVKISTANGLNPARRDTPVFDGTRVITSASGITEITLGGGCVLRLNPNEQVMLRGQLGCDCLRSTVQSISRLAGQVQQGAARTSIGRVNQVRGVVTVSDGASVGVAEGGAPFVEGARFLSSPLGSAELVLNNGCTVNLKANESLLVREQIGCDCLRATIESVPGGSARSLPVWFLGTTAASGVLAAISGSLALAIQESGTGVQVPPAVILPPLLSGQ